MEQLNENSRKRNSLVHNKDFTIKYLTNEETLNAKVSVKNILQEYLHLNNFSQASYLVISKDGQDHEPNFLVEVSVVEIGKVKAHGKSIKDAEINAAQKFIEEFNIG